MPWLLTKISNDITTSTRMPSHLSSFVWYNGVSDICRTQSSIYRYRVGGIQYIQYVASLVGSCFINSLITNNRWHHVLWIFIIEAKLRVVQWMNQKRNSPSLFSDMIFNFNQTFFYIICSSKIQWMRRYYNALYTYVYTQVELKLGSTLQV